jgi:hypothetical protein
MVATGAATGAVTVGARMGAATTGTTTGAATTGTTTDATTMVGARGAGARVEAGAATGALRRALIYLLYDGHQNSLGIGLFDTHSSDANSFTGDIS